MASSEVLSADTVSAADFIRNFARCRDEAERHPVFVSNHRRQTHVLLGIAEYERLAGERITFSDEEGEAAKKNLADFSAWIEVGMIVCDADFHMRSANGNAAAICGTSSSKMVGSNFFDLPGVRGSLIENMVARARETNQPSTIEMPSPFIPGCWINFRVLACVHAAIVIIRDITQEVKSQRMADVKGALLQAMAVHGGVGFVRVSIRGTVERVDASMCKFIGLPEDRIVGVPITDLVDVGTRVNFRNALEAVLRGEGAQKLKSRLISNLSDPVEVDVAIAVLHGTYGAEGAIMLITAAKENAE